jgi:hypothetical protein
MADVDPATTADVDPATDDLLAEADKHHKRTTGIGTGNCVLCRAKWPCETVGLAAALRAAQAERDAALWTCPDCAFSFDASHEDTNGGYSCPCCAEARLTAERDAAHAVIRRLLPAPIRAEGVWAKVNSEARAEMFQSFLHPEEQGGRPWTPAEADAIAHATRTTNDT